MKKITIYGRPLNGGDGSAYIRWYLSHNAAEEDYDHDFEVETYEGSNIHQEALEEKESTNYENYWREADYYEDRTVKAGKVMKSCACCGGTIKVGEPAVTHKFYPEFASANVHPGCNEKFLKNLR